MKPTVFNIVAIGLTASLLLQVIGIVIIAVVQAVNGTDFSIPNELVTSTSTNFAGLLGLLVSNKGFDSDQNPAV